MTTYGNLAANSGVREFECGDDWIEVKFRSGVRYRYSDRSTGRSHVRAMQKRARDGRGLSTYISQRRDAVRVESQVTVRRVREAGIELP